MRFKEWGDCFVGGVWTTTNAQKKEEIRCEWILDKSFIRLTWKDRRGVSVRVSRHRPRDRSMDHLGLRQQGPGL